MSVIYYRRIMRFNSRVLAANGRDPGPEFDVRPKFSIGSRNFRATAAFTGTMLNQATIGRTTVRLVTGDIAEQDTHAVVTAAHWRLNKGAGTDGTIHSKGGPAIFEECQRIGGCPIGDAVITTGGNLKARHVIHAVGPVWRGGEEHEPQLLASAYRRSLEVAVEHGLQSISIPSISTGAFCYPIKLAAPIAMRTVVDFLRNGHHDLSEVRIVLYSREDKTALSVFANALEHQLEGPDLTRDVAGK